MFRIRFHGRGGQGIKSASRILGTAFFLEGYEVQDAPRYGAERRGAPIFAYVRASEEVINERGIINKPDLIIVVDESLLLLPVAGVLVGATKRSVLLIVTDEAPEVWKKKLNLQGPVFSLSTEAAAEDRPGIPLVGTACIGAAAQLIGIISPETLKEAIRKELKHLGDDLVEKNLTGAMKAYDQMAPYVGSVTERDETPSDSYQKPNWIGIPFEDARISTPYVHAAVTSLKVETGAWRSLRPVIDLRQCHRCGLCHIFCPDSVIHLDPKAYPQIDYQHCKGCMICLVQCPTNAIEAIPEHRFKTWGKKGEDP